MCPLVPQYLLSRVQLLQDDAHVGAVLCVGTRLRGGEVGLNLCDSGCLIQSREESQTVTMLPFILFILFSLWTNFAQDLGILKKKNMTLKYSNKYINNE